MVIKFAVVPLEEIGWRNLTDFSWKSHRTSPISLLNLSYMLMTSSWSKKNKYKPVTYFRTRSWRRSRSGRACRWWCRRPSPAALWGRWRGPTDRRGTPAGLRSRWRPPSSPEELGKTWLGRDRDGWIHLFRLSLHPVDRLVSCQRHKSRIS